VHESSLCHASTRRSPKMNPRRDRR
jgi:hypothetical protein